MKPESKNKRPSRCLARLVVRWALLGWWIVPTLWLLREFAEMNESYWTGDATEIYWHRDDSMVALRKWSHEKLEAFFQHNVKEHAPLSAGASVDHGVEVETTDEHGNRAADRGCCDCNLGRGRNTWRK